MQTTDHQPGSMADSFSIVAGSGADAAAATDTVWTLYVMPIGHARTIKRMWFIPEATSAPDAVNTNTYTINTINNVGVLVSVMGTFTNATAGFTIGTPRAITLTATAQASAVTLQVVKTHAALGTVTPSGRWQIDYE